MDKLFTRVGRADEVLEAVLGPLDGTAERQRRPRDRDLLREHVRLLAEPAADVGAAHRHALDVEQRRQRLLHDVRNLGRGPHHEASVLRDGEHAAGFDRGRAVARVAKRSLHDGGRGFEARIDIAIVVGLGEDHVRGARIVVQRWQVRAQRILDRHHGGQGPVTDRDALGAILGAIPVRCDNCREGFAHEPRAVSGEDRALDPLRAGTRQVGHERRHAKIGGGERERHAGQPGGLGGVNVVQLGMGVGAPCERELERARRCEVVQEAAPARQQRPVLPPPDGSTDH